MKRPRPTGGWFAPPVTVHFGAETKAPVVVRDGRVASTEQREVWGVEVIVEPGETDGVDVFVNGDRADDELVSVTEEVIRRIEFDAAMDAYYRTVATGQRAPGDLRRYLRRLERDLGQTALEVAAEGFPT